MATDKRIGHDFTSQPRSETAEASERVRLLNALGDLAWHEHSELARIAGPRYGARIGELRDEGWAVIDEKLEKRGKQYRLTSQERGDPRVLRVKVFLYEEDAEALLALDDLPLDARAAIDLGLKSFRQNTKKKKIPHTVPYWERQ